MAKNKNRKQGGPQNRSPQTQQEREQAQRTATETHESPITHPQGSPADVARKQQKQRFGHN